MRVVQIVTLVALVACNSILGIGQIHVSGDDASGPDAGASDVHGVTMDVFFASSTTTVVLPRDLSTEVLQAYIPDGSASGFRISDVTSSKDGTFTIANVPAGPYYLLILFDSNALPSFFETTSHALDLGVKRLGRPDGRIATQSTVLTLHITGMTPGQDGDRLFVDSFATGTADDFLNVSPGQTSLDALPVDWKALGRPLLDAARGDDLYAVHQRFTPLAAPLDFQRTISDSFTTTAVTLVDGQPASVSGAFAVPSTSGTVNFQFDPASFVQDLDFTSHRPITLDLRVRANFYGGASMGAPLFEISRTFGASVTIGETSATYLDPYPMDWTRSILAAPRTSYVYAARGSMRTANFTGGSIQRLQFQSGNFFDFTAPFAAPHSIKVGGVDSSRATAIPFDGTHPVSVEWTAVVGVSHYNVLVEHLTDDGLSALLTPIATFDTFTNTMAMPASLFKVGDSYTLLVTAIVDPTTDYAGGTLSLLGFPESERDAPTARLLFAASCGNGTVDAAFEQCDEGRVATPTCNPDCTRPVCGDGFVNPAIGEQCDDAGDSLACNADCSPASCGDGKINRVRGETCDLGAGQNGAPGKCCSATCTLVPPATSCP